MSTEVELYDGHYEQLATEAQGEIRRETYGEDLGQASWITGQKRASGSTFSAFAPASRLSKWRAALAE